MNLGPPPEPLTSRQRTIVLIVALVCAATRLLALAETLWDWDEALFTLALRDYDVARHHPHPPGFPVYIAAAKLMRLVVGDDFRALQSINLIAAMLVFPAVFFFARELRVRFPTAVIAAVLFAFFPNVWFYGGGAFSDIPSVVLVLFAVTLLLRGARDRNAYWIGTLLLALAIGVRPQNVLIGLAPGVYATFHRKRGEIAVAILIAVVVIAAAFGGAAAATGSIDRYVTAVKGHGEYISRIDSWRSTDRPPLWRLFDRFFIKQYQSPALSIIASILAIVSVVGAIRDRSRPMLWNAMTFVPFAFLAWLMLDRFSISRFSIAYQPMFAIFVADGIRRAARFAVQPSSTDDGVQRVELAFAVALTLAFAAYTSGELKAVRAEEAPSIAAARAAVSQVNRTREQLIVGHNMTVFLDVVAPEYPYTPGIDDRSQPLGAFERSWLLAEVDETAAEGFIFRRRRGNLWNIARRHYFEVKLQPLAAAPRFMSGWYGPEKGFRGEWRWMGRRSVAELPPVAGRAQLRLHLGIPAEVLRQRPAITVTLNGNRIDRFRATQQTVDRKYRVAPAAAGAPNVLELETDRIVVPPGDGRELGVRLLKLAWGRD